jgi:5-methylcytosine-specific restriction endonuclease McrA
MEWQAKVYKKKVVQKQNKDEWAQLRIACFEHDHYRCQRCEEINSQGRGLSAHHIMPRSEGGADELENLITLCDSCHDFVEMSDLRDRTLISESYCFEVVGVRREVERDPNRPAWHSWVYGSGKPPY